MASKRDAYELLLIEEADAWFEYLEATRGQTRDPLQGARAVGVGPAPPAAAGDQDEEAEAEAGCGGVASAAAARASE